MKKPVTIYDIAKALKLTGSTVSRALRDRSDVGEETKKRVLAQARKMKYQPNLTASNLRTGKTKAIGIVVPKINNHFFSNVIAGIEHVSYQHGYNLIICQTNELVAKEIESVKMLMNQNVACIIISLSKTTLNTQHLQEVKSHDIQVIQFDRTDSALESLRIVNNNFESAIDAVKHLYEQGYKRPAFLAGPKNVNIFKERYEGFKKGLKLTGLSFEKNNVMFDCLSKEKAKAAMVKMLAGDTRPDAVLASADLAALGVLEAANELGIRVPSQLGICGFSNEPYTEITNPTLTTVDQRSIQMGQKIMEAFIDSGDRTKKQDPIIINAEMVVRKSTDRIGAVM